MSGRNSFDQAGGYSSYHSGGGSGPPGAPREMGGEFSRISQMISTNIQKITQNVSQMQRMIGNIGTNMDTPELRDKLHQIQHYTNQLAKETNQYLKDITRLPLSGSSSEQRQQKMLRERLMNEFSSVLNNFQAAQRQEKEREKESLLHSRAHSTAADPFADDSKSDEKLIGFDSDQRGVTAQLQMEDDMDIETLRERERAINKLESDIMDVNQIFKDLGMLVHEQGEVIDSIEANIESASVNVEQGVHQLLQARNYQHRVRRRKCCILLICFCVVTIIAIIIAISVSASK